MADRMTGVIRRRMVRDREYIDGQCGGLVGRDMVVLTVSLVAEMCS